MNEQEFFNQKTRKVMKKIIILFVMTVTILTATGQKCNCLSNLKWLIETFEKNDAGFQYVIDKKDRNAYVSHNKVFLEKAKNIKDKTDCLKLLNDWTEFFRKGHLQVVFNQGNGLKDIGLQSKAKKPKLFEYAPVYDIDLKQFKNYVSHLKVKNGFEGIWYSAPYTVGIIKDKDNPGGSYVGFIIKSGNPAWSPRQIKLKIYKTEDGHYDMTYYMGNHTPVDIKNVELLGNNYLLAGFIILKRLEPELEPDKQLDLFYKSMSAKTPFIEKISGNTVLLRIPSFMFDQKKAIDSLLDANKDLITKTPNLIIDLRNNGGGSDQSYEKLIPFLYTNPIRVVGLEYLSTELNNQRMLNFINNPDFSEEDKKWAKESYEKLSKHLGEFVNLDDEIVSVITKDTIFPYPQNIGILINKNCGSTTEQFLLAAKQSKKVKLFGTTTTGALDISNLNMTVSPCGEYQLWYGLTKSFRIPGMAIDDIGIQPDFYFDRTIKPYEWIKKTLEILNYK